MRALMLVAVTSLPLAGCNTTGLHYSTDGTITSSLGVDNGNRIDANAPTSPWSNQVSLKGDQSARLVELARKVSATREFRLCPKNTFARRWKSVDNVAAWVGLAASYDQLGRFDNSDRAHDQLAKLKGDDPRILNNRGYSYLLRGDYVKRASILQPRPDKGSGHWRKSRATCTFSTRFVIPDRGLLQFQEGRLCTAPFFA
ncbi:MAG: hypothetical protein R3D29_16475 [Nitratireductor sp.]